MRLKAVSELMALTVAGSIQHCLSIQNACLADMGYLAIYRVMDIDRACGQQINFCSIHPQKNSSDDLKTVFVISTCSSLHYCRINSKSTKQIRNSPLPQIVTQGHIF